MGSHLAFAGRTDTVTDTVTDTATDTALFTVGYEGRNLGGLAELLREHGVGVVVDVRELPLSRKKGFSKGALSSGLAEHGIGYVHDKRLGTPSWLRAEIRESGDMRALFREMRKLVGGQEEALSGVAELMQEASICLLCYEANPAECHRSVVAQFLEKRTGNPVRHL